MEEMQKHELISDGFHSLLFRSNEKCLHLNAFAERRFCEFMDAAGDGS